MERSDDDLRAALSLPKPDAMLWLTFKQTREKVLVRAAFVGRAHEPSEVGQWQWSTTGVPAPLLLDIVTRVSAFIEEHIEMVYGVQSELEWWLPPDDS